MTYRGWGEWGKREGQWQWHLHLDALKAVDRSIVLACPVKWPTRDSRIRPCFSWEALLQFWIIMANFLYSGSPCSSTPRNSDVDFWLVFPSAKNHHPAHFVSSFLTPQQLLLSWHGFSRKLSLSLACWRAQHCLVFFYLCSLLCLSSDFRQWYCSEFSSQHSSG
jgi:hypothetical protein